MGWRARVTHPLLVPAMLVAVIAGYLLGDRHTSAPRREAQQPARAQVLSDAGMLLEYPLGWSRTSRPQSFAGLTLSQPVTLAPSGSGGGGLLGGRLRAGEASLLPSAFLATLAAPPRTEVVSLASTSAYRYADLRPRGYAGSLTLYVLAGSIEAGPQLIACYAAASTASAALTASAASTLRACEAIADGVTTLGGASASIAPEAAYARTLAALLAGLEAQRASLRGRLARSPSAAGVEGPAQSLASAFDGAASSLAGVEAPRGAVAAQQALEGALRQTGQDYAALAAAARAGSLSAYDLARADVEASEADVDKALRSFSLLGYGSATS